MNIITADKIFVYLSQQESWASEMLIALELGTSIPVVQNLLTELGDVVESDRSGRWRIVKTVTTEIVSEETSELTFQEQKDLFQLETRVERGFYIAGLALKQIRDRKLYRQKYKTFEAYCRSRFDFTKAAARYLMGAVEVVDNLKSKQFVDIFPTKESQCRPLLGLTPEIQSQVWLEAVKQASGKVPSARLVKNVLEQTQGKKLNKQLLSKKSTKSNKKYKEGLNYKAGLGCEWYVKIEQSTYEKFQEYRTRKGLPTLNSALVELLKLDENNRNC
jgi:hypothetical protein